MSWAILLSSFGFVCFFVVTFNIDAKLFCLYVSGGFHLLAHRMGGWLAKLLGKSFKHFPTPSIVMATIT